jgi:hypothetical protein
VPFLRNGCSVFRGLPGCYWRHPLIVQVGGVVHGLICKVEPCGDGSFTIADLRDVCRTVLGSHLTDDQWNFVDSECYAALQRRQLEQPPRVAPGRRPARGAAVPPRVVVPPVVPIVVPLIPAGPGDGDGDDRRTRILQRQVNALRNREVLRARLARSQVSIF